MLHGAILMKEGKKLRFL